VRVDPAAGASDRPLVSLVLIAHRQEATVGEALAGALAQDWSPLEIVASDDASPDGTFAAMEAAAAGYAGPHALTLVRQPRNLGIGAHLSDCVARTRGALVVVAAGDDVSLPHRVRATVAAWERSGRALDLLAAPLVDIDADGRAHGELRPSDLAAWTGARQWVERPPWVVGAAQAWTRRLFDRFGPLAPGTVMEDQILVFRAIVSGGAATLDEPLVRYRRGGLSRRRRALDAATVAARLASNARHAVVELEQLLKDAATAGVLGEVGTALRAKLARETFVRDVFAADGAAARLRVVARASGVPLGVRLRVGVYAVAPWLLAPAFAIKRLVTRAA
jgi:glycosyltransferase involved in cell wall biosynthesis